MPSPPTSTLFPYTTLFRSVNVKTVFPNGSELVFPARTDDSGNARFSFYTRETGLYKFKVIRVVHPTRTYDASLNVETRDEDRKSTRLNSSHVSISYAVFCL